jgi:hypothetical protein
MSACSLCAALAGSIVALLGASAGAQSQQTITLTIRVVHPTGAPVAGVRVAAASFATPRSCAVQGFLAAGRVVRGGLAVTL